MKSMIHSNSSGLIATTAVILLAFSTLAFSITVLGSALLYSDLVNKRELRIQVNMNADSCLETVRLMLAKDYFLNGEFNIKDFGCNVVVTRNIDRSALVCIQSKLGGVSSKIIEKLINN